MKLSLADIQEKHRYMSGASASEEDISEGRAVFNIKEGSAPLNIQLPQYAWYLDGSTDRKLCVVVQAEEVPEHKIIGAFLTEDGGSVVGVESDFEFLGEELPKSA